MKENDANIEIAKKWRIPASRRFLAILEEMFTPEESKICLELFEPATCPELASKLKIDEKSLSKKLGELVDRGVLTRGKTHYGFHTTLIGFHHDVVGDTAVLTGPYALSQKVKKVWGDFFRNEWCDVYVNNWIERKKATGRTQTVWPAIGALELSPNIRPEQILPEEDYRRVLEKAKRIIVAPCGCRVSWGVCNHVLDICLIGDTNPRKEYYLGRPGRLLREVSLEEALALVHKAEEDGLVHRGGCWCCTCCCENLYSFKRAGRFDLMEPSRYLAVVNEELCIGCQDCIERCPFDAIEMRKVPGSKKLKASIISESCKGCGVCIVGCKQKALRYELVKPPEYITGIQPRAPSRTGGAAGGWGFYELE